MSTVAKALAVLSSYSRHKSKGRAKEQSTFEQFLIKERKCISNLIEFLTKTTNVSFLSCATYKNRQKQNKQLTTIQSEVLKHLKGRNIPKRTHLVLSMPPINAQKPSKTWIFLVRCALDKRNVRPTVNPPPFATNAYANHRCPKYFPFAFFTTIPSNYKRLPHPWTMHSIP